MDVHVYPRDDHKCINKRRLPINDSKPCDVFPIWPNELLLTTLKNKYRIPKDAWITNRDKVGGAEDTSVKANGLKLAPEMMMTNVMDLVLKNHNTAEEKEAGRSEREYHVLSDRPLCKHLACSHQKNQACNHGVFRHFVRSRFGIVGGFSPLTSISENR